MTLPSTRIKDITGQTFGRLTAIRFSHQAEKSRAAYWLCRCSCGSLHTASGAQLRCGGVRSCGCSVKGKRGPVTHGLSLGPDGKRSRLYSIWANMLSRCRNPNISSYRAYGARGITVCEEWTDFPAFHAWATSNGYAADLSLDRIDNDGNYEPANCRWVTFERQNKHRRDTRYITFGGQTLPVSDWAVKLGLNVGTLRSQLGELGWDVERALTTPVGKGKR